MLTTMPIAPGDIVVLGSDGLWDNVGEAEVVEEVERDVLEGECIAGKAGSGKVGSRQVWDVEVAWRRRWRRVRA